MELYPGRSLPALPGCRYVATNSSGCDQNMGNAAFNINTSVLLARVKKLQILVISTILTLIGFSPEYHQGIYYFKNHKYYPECRIPIYLLISHKLQLHSLNKDPKFKGKCTASYCICQYFTPYRYLEAPVKKTVKLHTKKNLANGGCGNFDKFK